MTDLVASFSCSAATVGTSCRLCSGMGADWHFTLIVSKRVAFSSQ